MLWEKHARRSKLPLSMPYFFRSAGVNMSGTVLIAGSPTVSGIFMTDIPGDPLEYTEKTSPSSSPFTRTTALSSILLISSRVSAMPTLDPPRPFTGMKSICAPDPRDSSSEAKPLRMKYSVNPMTKMIFLPSGRR